MWMNIFYTARGNLSINESIASLFLGEDVNGSPKLSPLFAESIQLRDFVRVVVTVYMGRSCTRGILTKGRDGIIGHRFWVPLATPLGYKYVVISAGCSIRWCVRDSEWPARRSWWPGVESDGPTKCHLNIHEAEGWDPSDAAGCEFERVVSITNLPIFRVPALSRKVATSIIRTGIPRDR